MSYVASQARLKALLDTITGNGKTISVCYDFPNPSPASFPAVYLIMTGGQEETETTSQDLASQTFIVRVVIKALWTSAGYTKALTCIDTVLALLRLDASRTSGTIVNIEVSPDVRVNYVDSAQGKMIFADIRVVVKDLLTNG